MIPAPEAHRTIAGGKRGEAERAHRMGREERNIRPGGAAEPTRDKILLRPAGAVRYSGGDPLPVGALGFASLPTGYCPLRLPAPGNITITQYSIRQVQLPGSKCPPKRRRRGCCEWTLSSGKLY